QHGGSESAVALAEHHAQVLVRCVHGDDVILAVAVQVHHHHAGGGRGDAGGEGGDAAEVGTGQRLLRHEHDALRRVGDHHVVVGTGLPERQAIHVVEARTAFKADAAVEEDVRREIGDAGEGIGGVGGCSGAGSRT